MFLQQQEHVVGTQLPLELKLELGRTRVCDLLMFLVSTLFFFFLATRTCGRYTTPTGAQARIVGGRPADVGEYPWMVHLLLGGANLCSASILDEYHLMTAGHCMDGRVYFVCRLLQTFRVTLSSLSGES